MQKKLSLPKGTRDFTPDQTKNRHYIFSTLKQVFALYGFEEIITPALENSFILNEKYGEEGSKLMFNVLNSGHFLSEVDQSILDRKDSNKALSYISEKALRYDLTVPFARYIVMNKHNITMPFKRFQIGSVWRADRPQKNRYREFTQCDCDIIGSEGLVNESELISLINTAFDKLFERKVAYQIQVNNFKVLESLYQFCDLESDFYTFVSAIDKLEKIGFEKVVDILSKIGLSEEKKLTLIKLIQFKGSTDELLNYFTAFFSSHNLSKKGLEELETVLNYSSIQNEENILFNPFLSRGLNYYTGIIYEVKVKGYPSICGGGRYDNLTESFSSEKLSGVGISFGADRIYDIMEDENMFSDTKTSSKVKILLLNFGKEETDYALPILKLLRSKHISSEIYPTNDKIKKQMKYANAINVKYIFMTGSEEVANKSVIIKNMSNGEQNTIDKENILNYINHG